MNGLPQNVLLNFRLEFPKSDLTIYLSSRISEIFCQMVSTPERTFVKNSYKRSRTSLPSPPLLFIAFFTSHRSPLSERLEQAKTLTMLGDFAI